MPSREMYLARKAAGECVLCASKDLVEKRDGSKAVHCCRCRRLQQIWQRGMD